MASPPMASDGSTLAALVTGANTGVGFETARLVAARGEVSFVGLCCRTESKAAAALERLRALEECAGVEFGFFPLDLGSLASAKECADRFLATGMALKALVCNAGTASPRGSVGNGGLSPDGVEWMFQTNYLGHALLASLLLPALRRGAPSRVVNVASVMHRLASTDFAVAAATPRFPKAYKTSKLAQILHALEFNRRHREADGVTAVAVSPGAVDSDIWRYERGFLGSVMPYVRAAVFLTPEQGAATSVFAASQELYPEPRSDAVPYLAPYWTPSFLPLPFAFVGPFAGARETETASCANDPALAAELWSVSEALLGQRGYTLE